MKNPFEKEDLFKPEVARVVDRLSTMNPETPEYGNAVKSLEVLCTARSFKSRDTIDPNVLITAATNILGILLVLNYEQLNVVASKAITFIIKPR